MLLDFSVSAKVVVYFVRRFIDLYVIQHGSSCKLFSYEFFIKQDARFIRFICEICGSRRNAMQTKNGLSQTA